MPTFGADETIEFHIVATFNGVGVDDVGNKTPQNIHYPWLILILSIVNRN
jgi:hypothetical protein